MAPALTCAPRPYVHSRTYVLTSLGEKGSFGGATRRLAANRRGREHAASSPELASSGGTTGNERASPGGTGDRAMGEAGADVRRGGAPPRRGAVYVDDAIWEWRGLRWAHLLADDTDDLHRFAAALGIHRTSYQGPPRTSVPHYDRVRAAARARSWRDCLQPRRDRRGRASDAVVLRGVRSRSRLLTHDRD